jgi:hypothetical protein
MKRRDKARPLRGWHDEPHPHHGIEKAGSLDRDAVYKVIQEDEIPTVMGKFKAVGEGIATINPFPMQNQDGKVVVIWPPELKTGDYHFPRTQ